MRISGKGLSCSGKTVSVGKCLNLWDWKAPGVWSLANPVALEPEFLHEHITMGTAWEQLEIQNLKLCLIRSLWSEDRKDMCTWGLVAYNAQCMR